MPWSPVSASTSVSTELPQKRPAKEWCTGVDVSAITQRHARVHFHILHVASRAVMRAAVGQMSQPQVFTQTRLQQPAGANPSNVVN